jgi:hypothetical protein
MRHIAAAGLVLLLMGQHSVSWAESSSGGSTPDQVAYGAGSALGTLVYAPLKGAFCILGGIGSVFTLPFGGSKMAGEVVGASCRGTWVITPDVLRGKEQVKFVGDVPA